MLIIAMNKDWLLLKTIGLAYFAVKAPIVGASLRGLPNSSQASPFGFASLLVARCAHGGTPHKSATGQDALLDNLSYI